MNKKKKIISKKVIIKKNLLRFISVEFLTDEKKIFIICVGILWLTSFEHGGKRKKLRKNQKLKKINKRFIEKSHLVYKFQK